MSSYILKNHNAKQWLNIIGIIDLLVLSATVVAMTYFVDKDVIFNPYLLLFVGVLVMCNMWFIVDYAYTTRGILKEKYKNDYVERQIRFALVCHVFDPNKMGKTIYFSKFKNARDWFYSRFDISKGFRDEIAVCMGSVSGCYRDDLNFSDHLLSYIDGHPIESVYFTGIPNANSSHPYLQCSTQFGDGGSEGMTLLFVCETSFDFFEEQIEKKLKNCIHNQDKTTYHLASLFEARDMANRFSIKLEYHKLEIL